MKKRFKSLVSLLLCVIGMLIIVGCSAEDQKNSSPNYLVLVNKDNPISADYINSLELCEVESVYEETCQVEKETKKAYDALRSDLLEQGIEIGVDSAYRSIKEQQEIMDEFIEKYGMDYAKSTVAEPGVSEHHTALVIDIVPKVGGEWIIENEDMLAEKEIFSVIHKTMPEYGFILRYPKGKEAITGYDYEPWHIRYVGKKAAKEIYEKGITLEEYLHQ